MKKKNQILFGVSFFGPSYITYLSALLSLALETLPSSSGTPLQSCLSILGPPASDDLLWALWLQGAETSFGLQMIV